MELPINDAELATIVGALRLGGDTSLYQKLKIIKEIREENPGGAKINDWHTRHEDQHLEVYCDNHPDSLECRVYDD